MKAATFPILALALANLSMLLSAGSSATAGMIDDFNTVGLSEYTKTIILDNAIGEENINLSDASGALVATYGGATDAAEQLVLLRDDISLAIGEKLVVDVAQSTSTSQMDFGIVVSSTAATLADTDTRNTFDWASIAVRPTGNNLRVSRASNGVVSTSSGTINVDETLVRQLFIKRNSATSFQVGYVNANTGSHNGLTINFTNPNVGSAIGFYADLRCRSSPGSARQLAYRPRTDHRSTGPH